MPHYAGASQLGMQHLLGSGIIPVDSGIMKGYVVVIKTGWPGRNGETKMANEIEIAAITAHLTDAGYSASQIARGLAVAEAHDAADADETLSFVVGAILGDDGDRYGVEPGSVAALIAYPANA